MKSSPWIEFALSFALLAHPAAFRRRFGSELRRDFRLSVTTSGILAILAALVTVIMTGLAERGSAMSRSLFWGNHHRHMYTPSGRQLMFWDKLRSDVHYIVRLALKTPVASGLMVLALALGIGANTAIFAVVNSVLVKSLPYVDSDRLVMIWSNASTQSRPRNTVSPANFLDFQKMNRTLVQLEAYFSFVTPLEVAIGDQSEVPISVVVTPGLFEMLGRRPVIGRSFAADSEAFEILLSHGYWQRRFGGDPNVIGRSVTVYNDVATIVGVMPADFTFPYGAMLGPSGFTRTTSVDLWTPMHFSGALAIVNRLVTGQGQIVRGTHWLGTIGRMRPGVTPEQVQADLSTVARQLEQAYPDTNTGWGATVVPVLEQTVGSIRVPLLVLLVGVAFVLLIATVNVANLVLARSISRQKELATRIALGAGQGRVVQQALTEGLVLASTGGIVGVLFGYWGTSALVSLAPPDLPRVHEIAPDATMLLVTGGVTLVTGILVGLLPAIRASMVGPQAALQENSRGTVGRGLRHRVRATLVVGEVALAVTLTIGAGLLLRSFTSLLSVNPGFEPANLLTWQMNLPDRLKTPEERIAFYRDFLDRMKALPGVVSIGGTSRLPLGSTGLTTSIDIEGRPRPQAEWPEVQFRRVVGDYFQTMSIPFLQGRMFNETDALPSAPVCIVNQALALQFFPGKNPVGQQLRTNITGPAWTIIGLVGNVKHAALDEVAQPEMYASTYQGLMLSPYMVVRTTGNAADLIHSVRAEAQAMDRDLPFYRIQTMESVRSESVAQRRFLLTVVGVFGVFALALAAIGVYGVMSLLVGERTQEVGVRLALGAHPAQVMTMLLAQALRLTGLGAAIGVGMTMLLMPLLENQLYAVQPRDPITLTGVPLVLVVVAMLAALIPACRAMRLDPVQALRYE